MFGISCYTPNILPVSFIFIFDFLLRSFCLIKAQSVLLVIVLYNTLVTSYIFWAHHVEEYYNERLSIAR